MLVTKNKREEYDAVLMKESKELGAIEGAGAFGPRVLSTAPCCNPGRSSNYQSPCCIQCIGGSLLDDVVDPGLSLLLDITGMLLQFQELPVAIQVDIKKAFFMIEEKKSDRPHLQFLLPDEAGTMTI